MSRSSSAKAYDVVTIGAATRDVFVESRRFKSIHDAQAPDGVDACFPLGSKIDIDNLLFETGGGATNAAVTFSRFGLKTSCIARIGNDLGGREIGERLRHEKVDVSHLQTDPRDQTGYSIILLSGSGQRAILVFRGASRHIDGKGISWNKLSPAWVYLTSVGGNMTLLKRIVAEQKKQGFRIAWNPGNAELALGEKALRDMLRHTDILIVNREEAAELASLPPRDIHAIFHELGPLPRQAMVMTDGERGAYVFARGTIWLSPALPAKRINTTGAGDAFGSAFVATVIKTGDLETALRAGTLNATGVISHMGAKAGILKHSPTAAELKRVRIKLL